MMKSMFAAFVAASAFSASAANAPASAPAASAPAAAAPAAPAPAAPAPAAATAPAAPDAAKGGTLFAAGDASRGITACMSCHGDSGNATMAGTPKLASQHAAYIVKQLTEFKSGARANPTMAPMAKNLTDDDIRNIAAYVSAQTLKPAVAKNKDTVELGKKIFRGGIKDKNVPACNGCHGPTGAGIPAQFARIGGQNEDYVEAQLNGFSAGTRGNNAIMATIAARMSPNEIKAVSDYVAGLR
jgi:cytochrome c553